MSYPAAATAIDLNVEFFSIIRPRTTWRNHNPRRRSRRNTRRGRALPLVKQLVRKCIKLAHSAYPELRTILANGLEVMVFGMSMAAALGSLWLLGA